MITNTEGTLNSYIQKRRNKSMGNKPAFEEYYEGDFEVVAASQDALLYIRDHHQALAFAWPTDDPGWDPLLVDATTANALITIYYALSVNGQEKFVRMLTNNRLDFTILVDFTWSHVK